MSEPDLSTELIDIQTQVPTTVPEAISNPLLCHDCQYLNDPVSVVRMVSGYGRARTSASLETIRQRTACIVCAALSRDLLSPIESDSELRLLPASQIFVQSKGPSFLDNSYDFADKHEHRYDKRNSEEIILRLILNITLLYSVRGAIEISAEWELSSQGWKSLTDSQKLQIECGEELEKRQVTPQYCLAYSVVNQKQLLRIDPWEVPYFDVSLLSSWISSCEAFHGESCDYVWPENTDMPSEFRVIDVRSMSVIKPTQQTRYAALSYVWQQAREPLATAEFQLQRNNMDRLSRPGGLEPAALPFLLADSIALCRDIGESYLWIDRLCIIQDDPETKHSLICAMDKIYRCAAFTIVSAATQSGLRGYSQRPRQKSISCPPRNCKHEGGGVESYHREMLYSSPWNQRGWTFQERVLSRRCIFVTDYQVIWECRRGEAVEEYTWSLGHLSEDDTYIQAEKEISQLQGGIRDQGFRRSTNYSTDIPESIEKYWAWAEDYISRSMSLDTDILNAFSGVANYLAYAISTQLLFGLPESHLNKAILWTCSEPPEPRRSTPHVPTWSWASWKQAISYEGFKYDDFVSLVYFHYQDPLGGQRQLDVKERWLGIDYPISTFETTDLILDTSVSMPNTAGKYMPAQWRSTKTWQECPHNPWRTLKHKELDFSVCEVAKNWPGALIFNTTVASLNVAFTDAENSRIGELSQRTYIRSLDGEIVGCLKGATIVEDRGKLYDFVVICGGIADFTTRKVLVGNSRMAGMQPDYDLWRLYVMRVERLPSELHVARRIDVGYVYTHKWHLCNPRWETVVLC